MDYKQLGTRIRKERKRLHLTQAALAEAIDISDTYMGAIERGERSLTLDTLARLVDRLGVSFDYILTGYIEHENSDILEQFKQITAFEPPDRQQMAIDVIRTIFTQLGNEGNERRKNKSE